MSLRILGLAIALATLPALAAAQSSPPVSAQPGTTAAPSQPTQPLPQTLVRPQLQPMLQPSPAPPDTVIYAPAVPDAQVTETTIERAVVFGQGLFQGRFAAESFKGFNPDYLLSVGDQVDIKLWGALDAQLILLVDAQGNIFIPRVGPVRVVNVRNGELNDGLDLRVRDRVDVRDVAGASD